ncbi:MAG: SPOR domain-containing protein [Bacteroidota bacterium]
MTIGNTIRQLLEEGKKVILPGFGNLEITETGIGVPSSGKRIDPPGRAVKFDSSFSKDDGLVASTFAGNESMDPEEAGQQVLELVDVIKFAFDKGESWAVEGAGTFSRDADGKVHFQVEKGWILEPDQYGLESMDLIELEDEPPAGEAAEMPGEKEKVLPISPKPAAPVHEPRKNEKPKRRVNLWRVIWMIAGSLIAVLVVLIVVPAEKLQIFEGRKDTEKSVPKEQPSAIKEQPALKDTREAAEPRAADTEKPVVAGPEQSTPPGDVPAEHRYFLIAGSFKNLANASELQDQLNARGYHAEVMFTENRMYRVSVASYINKKEAERGLEKIKSVPGLGNCWLLSNE